MIIFKPSVNYEDDLPLTWRSYKDQGKVLECSPVIVCPNGHYLSIYKHTVSQDGMVSPSVVCPIDGCGFHEYIKLDNWQ